MNTRPEYKQEYHYPKGSTLPLAELVLSKRCYINLADENYCPKCKSRNTRLHHTDGPTRTRPSYAKVVVQVWSCKDCAHSYINSEVID